VIAAAGDRLVGCVGTAGSLGTGRSQHVRGIEKCIVLLFNKLPLAAYQQVAASAVLLLWTTTTGITVTKHRAETATVITI
jgi:hypothetical protein